MWKWLSRSVLQARSSRFIIIVKNNCYILQLGIACQAILVLRRRCSRWSAVIVSSGSKSRTWTEIPDAAIELSILFLPSGSSWGRRKWLMLVRTDTDAFSAAVRDRIGSFLATRLSTSSNRILQLNEKRRMAMDDPWWSDFLRITFELRLRSVSWTSFAKKTPHRSWRNDSARLIYSIIMIWNGRSNGSRNISSIRLIINHRRSLRWKNSLVRQRLECFWQISSAT